VTEQLRVALLARAGAARDQLRKALEEAGAAIVAEGDPGELDPKDVAAKLPKVLLVGLEPATEKSIDRFDALFETEGVEVIFDDAEVTAKLDGWDLNRWARHLAGKLTGSEVLPPAPEGAPAIGEYVEQHHDAGAVLQPGLPPTPAQEMESAKLEDYTSESPELAEWVPTSPSLTDGPQPAPEASATGEDPDEGKEFKLDTDLGIDVDLGSLEFVPASDSSTSDTSSGVGDYGAQDIPDMPDLPSGGDGVRFSTFDSDASHEGSDLDADVAALAAQLEAFEKSDTRGAPIEPEFARPKTKEDEAIDLAATAVMPKGAVKVETAAKPAMASAAASPSGKGSFDFSNLSLSSMDAEAELAKAPPIEPKFAKPEPPPSKASAFGNLSLEGEEPPPIPAPAFAPAPVAAAAATSGGAVLILAGLGGPDAVRQLLSSLPAKLSVPVLLYQHLEVGKHERLVEQLSKISKLPVVLAREGDAPVPGRVALLPSGMTAVSSGNGLKFAPGNLSQLVSALPPKDSMVVVLSGADAQLVPMIMAVKDGGGTVLAQDPEVCFDAAAAEAMRREGAGIFPALGLAQQIAGRWSA
jgi:chemotaxis response regulator CheB